MRETIPKIGMTYQTLNREGVYDLNKITGEYTEQQEHLLKSKQWSYNRYLETSNNARATVITSNRTSSKDCSIHYLGLNKHPHVINKAKEAIDLYGIWNTSAMSSSCSQLYEVLKKRFERIFGKEECLLFSNQIILSSSIIPTLCTIADETLIIVDEESHASTIDACRMSGSRFIYFKHNSVKDLEGKLKWFSDEYKQILVITESAYSMEGDISPLRKIVELKKKYNVLLFVDETHTFGFHGKNGAGICDDLGITNDVDFITTTLSKSNVGMGGVLATSKEFASLLKLSPSYLSQKAIPPSDLAVVHACLDLIENDPDIVDVLWEKTNYVRQQLLDLGFHIGKNKSPVVSVYISNDEILQKIEEELSEQGIFTMAVRYPVVKMSETNLRFVINNSDKPKDIDDLIFFLLKLGKKYGLINKQTSYKSRASDNLPVFLQDELNGFCQNVNIHLSNRINDFHQDFIVPRKNNRHLVFGNKIPGKGDIMLNGNDYLCISNHPLVNKSRIEHLSKEYKEVLMSAIFLRKKSPQKELQEKLADFLNFEASILSQSGWAANVGLLQSIADAKTPVYIDQFAHTSLWEGISSAQAKPIMFAHNSVERFKRVLSKYGSGILLVDSLYSTIGTICPLKEIIEVAKEYNCIVVVDESHSLGVYGENGRGLVHELGLTDQVDFLTVSLAKAFGGRAGLIACSKKFASYFPYVSRPAIFSSALLENEIVSLDATLDVLIHADDRRKRLHDNAAYLRNGIREMGIKLASQSQIISLVTGTEEQTEKVRDMLENQGVFGAVFCKPATSKNHALIRMTVNSELNKNDLNRILAAVKNVAEYIKK